MVTVNENLPENHPAHVTDFGDIRDEEHMPPGNTFGSPAPTQDELQEANEAAEEARGTVVGDASTTTGEEDLIGKPHQGSSSWYSDPDAMSSDITQRNNPGYEGNDSVGVVETEETGSTGVEEELTVGSELFDPTTHTIAQVEAYVDEYPSDRARVLQAEHDSENPRSSLITKLENRS